MDFIDKQHIAFLKIGQHGGQITGAFDHRPGGGADIHAHFVCYDIGQRGFAQPGRAIEEDVIQRFLALSGGLNEYRKVGTNLFLANIFGQLRGAQGGIPVILTVYGRSNQAVFFGGFVYGVIHGFVQTRAFMAALNMLSRSPVSSIPLSAASTCAGL